MEVVVVEALTVAIAKARCVQVAVTAVSMGVLVEIMRKVGVMVAGWTVGESTVMNSLATSPSVSLISLSAARP